MSGDSYPKVSRLRKAFRYIRLYGVSRTWVKVKQQAHLNRRYEALPRISKPPPEGSHVGIIGCGGFAFGVIAYYLKRRFGRVIRGVMDINIHRAASLYENYGAGYYTDDATRVFSDAQIDTVFIASNHASHTKYAIEALEQGKHVHIEKPPVTTREQLNQLCEVILRSKGNVALGFNRPVSKLGAQIFNEIASSTGLLVANWAVIGHPISDAHWYSKPEEGGRVFGNLCHWTDFSLQLVRREARYPLRVQGVCTSDSEVGLTLRFGDGSIVIISFSALGDSFEGVRERLVAQRGDVIVQLDDFQRLVVDRSDRRSIRNPLHRDHGHEKRIVESYNLSRMGSSFDRIGFIRYLKETANLFMAAKESMEQGCEITLEEPR
jgi:predicted dehydrogenase